MPDSSPPSPSDRTALRRRQKRKLHLLAAVLVVGAVAIVALAGKIPLPMRLMTAAVDLVAAAALALFARQNFRDA